MKSVLYEPLAELSEIRAELYDKFVDIVRENKDLTIIRIHA